MTSKQENTLGAAFLEAGLNNDQVGKLLGFMDAVLEAGEGADKLLDALPKPAAKKKPEKAA